MNWYKKSQSKILYVMRGLPGAGKSTLAKELGKGGVVFSTDDFFMVDGEYQFDPEMLGEAHFWNLTRATEAISKGVSPIVIDNTNVEAFESQKYVQEALKHGYKIEIREATAPWRFDTEELAKRNTHGVPKEIIEDMLNRWDKNMSVEDILAAERKTKTTDK